jgi:putative ABC transport system permease protein
MVTLGQGTTASVTASVASLGSNILMVRAGQAGPGPASATADNRNFTIKDVDAVENEVPGVATVAPMLSRNLTAIYGNVNHAQQVTGTDDRYFVARAWDVASGRTFTEGEIQAGSASCILGATTSQALFAGSDPIGETIRLRQVACTVIGVLASKGNSGFGQDQDDTVVIPYTSHMKRVSRRTFVNSILIQAASAAAITKVQQDITDTMLLRHRGELDFTVRTQLELAQAMTATSKVMSILLAAIASVSLIVGGIGIMNIMLVSVTERTREIGIRMAVGARGGDILVQFLVEAVTLSLIGGLIGIGLGIGASQLVSSIMSWPTLTPVSWVIIASLSSGVVGIVSGFYPAWKASKLDPIEALRYE